MSSRGFKIPSTLAQDLQIISGLIGDITPSKPPTPPRVPPRDDGPDSDTDSEREVEEDILGGVDDEESPSTT